MPRRRRMLRWLCAPLAGAWTIASWASLSPSPLLVDKPEQRRLHVLTQPPLVDAAVLMPAQVVADPRRRWRTMADQPGFLEPPAGGFPLAGKPVVAGQVLAWLRPALSDPERRDLQSRRAISQQDFDVANLQVHRFDIDVAQENTVSLQTPAIQIVADFKDAKARNGVLDQALNDRVPLVAAADGLLLTSLAQTQRVVRAGDLLFEGVGASSFGVDLSYDDDTLDASRARQAYVNGDASDPITLLFLGESLDPVTRSSRALYAVGAQSPLAVAQPLRVSLPRKQPRIRLPRSSVFAVNGQSWVWVHDDTERFEPRAVATGAVDAGWLDIKQGLDGSERVVVDAAALTRRASR